MQDPLSMKHILFYCSGLNASRTLFLFHEALSLKDLFRKILPENIVDFFIKC